MKRNKNRDRLVCGFLSLILAAGMTQGCASPHVSDQSNHNSQETGEDQTPSYSYEDTDKAESSPAPAETNSSSGAGKKKTPDDEKIPDNEKTPDDASKDKTDQKKNSSDAASQEEKAKKENQEKASSKKEAATIKAESPDADKKEESKPDRTDPDPDYEQPETSDPDSEDRQDPDETEIEEEYTEERDYYDEDSLVEYDEEEDTGEDLTDDLPGSSDEDVIPEEISAAEDTSAPEETAQTDTAMGEIQDMPEDTPEEPVYDILSYISSIESLENLVGQLEMFASEPRMLADYQDAKAYDKDSLHIEFSYEGSRMYISNDGEVLPNIVNVTAGSSLLGEDYSSLSAILEAQGWIPVASEIDPADSVISASYNQSVNGMDLVFTIYFKEDNKINRWTIENLQQLQ